MDRHQRHPTCSQQEGEVWSSSNFRLLVKNSRRSGLAEFKLSSAETRTERILDCSGDFKITFLLKAVFAWANLAPAGFGSEAQDEASFFALPQRRLALHSALVLASRLRTLIAPLGAEAA